ncbi:hypothetical protein [Actinomadura sp. DC4]|uniref:hypothetical protein n=1 Tax=Actinomadura sp. DC4 TaxID=3055069 RepID=UPI0025AF3B61|nr:hypothetical protein [Actinomadura sp. DC4]MDN3360127.1 hypothetical protein [Actinomadura sp. DC4]
MTTTSSTMPGTVTRYWGTAVAIANLDISGIIRPGLGDSFGPSGTSYEDVPISVVVADEQALREQFLTSMNALAQAQDAEPVANVDVTVHVWRQGYDLPAMAYQEDFVGWCYLATSPAPQHSESGSLSFADPRAGAAMTAMPGLPWGRQVMIRPRPGAHAAVPGWLTCSVVPVEHDQYAVVAIAKSAR